MSINTDRVYAIFSTAEPVDDPLFWTAPAETLRGFRQTQRGSQVAARAWSRKGYGTAVRHITAREALAVIAAEKASAK